MVPVKFVYNPQRGEYFEEGLATLIDCSKLAIDEYNKVKGTDYVFMELGNMAFSQQFRPRCKDGVIYTISFVAMIIHPERKPKKFFTAKVFCAPNWSMTSFLFSVLDIELTRKADTRFYHILPFPSQVVYDPLGNIPVEDQLSGEIERCVNKAIEEYNKHNGLSYRLVTSLHASRESLYGGVSDYWVYTIKFTASREPHKDAEETFKVKVIHGNKKDENGFSVLVLDLEILTLCGTTSDVKEERNDDEERHPSKKRKLKDKQDREFKIGDDFSLDVAKIIYNPPEIVNTDYLCNVILLSFEALDLYNRVKGTCYSFTTLVSANTRPLTPRAVSEEYRITIKASLPNNDTKMFGVRVHNVPTAGWNEDPESNIVVVPIADRNDYEDEDPESDIIVEIRQFALVGDVICGKLTVSRD